MEGFCFMGKFNLFWAAGFGLFYVRLLECVITLVIFW